MEQVLILLKNSLPLLIQGFWTTIFLWAGATTISFIFGIVLGVLRSNALRIPYISMVLDCMTFIFRGIPFYVQLLIAYFVVPYVMGIHASAFVTALVSLGLCSASYVSQIVRGGINAISVGQWEAAYVLGCSSFETVRYIIVPQMVKIVLPALVAECDQLLKSSSIVSVIGVLELTGAARNIVSQEMNPLTMYTLLALIYLCISAVLAFISILIERKMKYDV
jgi:polar amino acid transport system permease protein